MTFIFSWHDAIQQSTLPPTTRHVLLNLSCSMNAKGKSCYPSIEKQAVETGLSKRAVIEHLSRACDAGFIIKRAHGYSGRGWKLNEYIAAFPEGCQLKRGTEEDQSEEAQGSYPASPPSELRQLPSRNMVVTQGNSTVPLNSPSKNISKKIYKKNALLTLAEWEERVGSPLCIEQMQGWVNKKGARAREVRDLIDEFRDRVTARGYTCADFTAAFKDWLRRGFLSKKLPDIQGPAPGVDKSKAHFIDTGFLP